MINLSILRDNLNKITNDIIDSFLTILDTYGMILKT